MERTAVDEIIDRIRKESSEIKAEGIGRLKNPLKKGQNRKREEWMKVALALKFKLNQNKPTSPPLPFSQRSNSSRC